MATVREVTFDLFRAHGMTTIFGNPGSTELPMLADFPDDFTYVLGLQELVVVGMADGYAQATGRPTHVNLHTAPGVGNAVGGIFNAQANKSPLVITAGQQVRPQITIEANLTNRDATRRSAALREVEPRATAGADVPGAIGRAIHHATLPPRGPAFVSIPMDDWNPEADADRRAAGPARRSPAARRPTRRPSPRWPPGSTAAERPALVAGPDIDASGGWEAAVALAEKQRLPVWATPATGGSRLGFPERHPNFVGILPPAIGPIRETLKAYDLVLVAGSPVFPYYPYIPGPLLAEGTELVAITSDPGEAAGRRWATRSSATPAWRCTRLLELVPEAERPDPEPRPEPGDPPTADPLSGSEAMAALADAWPRGRDRRRRDPVLHALAAQPAAHLNPGSYYFCASGGLGFGIAAAVGVQLASPTVRWCACSARARPSTGSPRCGARRPTSCR